MRLIDDVFYQFEQLYAQHSDLDPTAENVMATFGWYSLNTYITNTSDGRMFVVDGQQRLTTLTLILVALYRMSEDAFHTPKRSRWIASKIYGVGTGGEERFWMSHEKRKPLMRAFLDGDEV